MPDQFGHSDTDLERGDIEYMRAKEGGKLPTEKRPAKPDWEGFGKAVCEHWPVGDIEGADLFDLALSTN